ncbi:hypothetical protein SAMN05444280_12272 [Tangfeifania diversioriginum]|uniref:Uncharacterized protein n=1 Tax=Tangfeifania diversioriginum TaxID=1168035 RepID=A0A1M6K888_9BACT|nr:hypothetical protein SAMN05444280_12272 [Tangfeifania diversioriginum]
MKAIILAASIFYVLCLTLSNYIGISIKPNQVDSITTPKIIKHKPSDFPRPAVKPNPKSEKETLNTPKPLDKEE